MRDSADCKNEQSGTMHDNVQNLSRFRIAGFLQSEEGSKR